MSTPVCSWQFHLVLILLLILIRIFRYVLFYVLYIYFISIFSSFFSQGDCDVYLVIVNFSLLCICFDRKKKLDGAGDIFRFSVMTLDYQTQWLTPRNGTRCSILWMRRKKRNQRKRKWGEKYQRLVSRDNFI